MSQMLCRAALVPHGRRPNPESEVFLCHVAEKGHQGSGNDFGYGRVKMANLHKQF